MSSTTRSNGLFSSKKCNLNDSRPSFLSSKLCGSLGAVKKGQEIHAEIGRQGLIDENSIPSTALLDVYAKCGAFTKPFEVFNKIPAPDVSSWNVLIARNAQYG
jgi:hypothetical protein